MSIASELRHGGSPDCDWQQIVDSRDLSNIEMRGAILHLLERIEELEKRANFQRGVLHDAITRIAILENSPKEE